jgi:hypothetical protein
MLLKNLDRFKVSTTNQAVTSFAGVPLVLGTAVSLGVNVLLNKLRLKERARGYEPAENILAMMGMLASGGVALDDERLLSGDGGMRALLGSMPAANTQGDFLRRFTSARLYGLGQIVLTVAVKIINALRLKQVTLDVDAFFIDSQKDGVAMNHEGRRGYCPVMVTCAELKMPLAGLFRPGHASPRANLVGLVSRVMDALAGKGLRFRSDSAGYQAEVVKLCDERGALFTITARKDEAVMTTVQSIPQKAWRPYVSPAYPNRPTEIAETGHAFENLEVKAHRLIVLRWMPEQPELWEVDRYRYHAVMTSFEDRAETVLDFHRQRQDESENTNKEVIATGLDKLPCREIAANAAFFQIVLLTAVVITALKYLVLPEAWRSLTIATLRYRLIRLAGLVQRRARALWLKIPATYPFRTVFEDARYRVLGVGCEIASTG